MVSFPQLENILRELLGVSFKTYLLLFVYRTEHEIEDFHGSGPNLLLQTSFFTVLHPPPTLPTQTPSST